MITIVHDKTRKHCPFFLMIGRGKRATYVDLIGATSDNVLEISNSKGFSPDNFGRIL